MVDLGLSHTPECFARINVFPGWPAPVSSPLWYNRAVLGRDIPFYTVEGRMAAKYFHGHTVPRAGVLFCSLCLVLFAVTGCKDPESVGIAVIQFVDTEEAEQVITGVRAGLASAGILPGDQYRLEFLSAGGDFQTLQMLAHRLYDAGTDVIISFGTPATQAVCRRKATGSVVVFGIVSDPGAAGLVAGNGSPLENVTGYYGLMPVEPVLELIHQTLPDAKKIGILRNPAEVNSERYARLILERAPDYGLVLVEKPVSGTVDLLPGAEALAAEPVDVFFLIGDNTVIEGSASVMKVFLSRGIPVFSNILGMEERGAVIAVGRSFYREGYDTARLAASLVKGEKNIKDCTYIERDTYNVRFNRTLMQAYDIVLPAAITCEEDDRHAPEVTVREEKYGRKN